MLFHAQAADGPEFEFGLLPEDKETADSKERKQFDFLMDVEPNPRVLKLNGEEGGMYFHLQPFRFFVNCFKASKVWLYSGTVENTDAFFLSSFLCAGIQTAVRMLEHTLKNLHVYRDSKPKLDSIQTPYREREKRV